MPRFQQRHYEDVAKVFATCEQTYDGVLAAMIKLFQEDNKKFKLVKFLVAAQRLPECEMTAQRAIERLFGEGK